MRGVSNTQSKQSQENLTLRRTSLVGLIHIPRLVSALNRTNHHFTILTMIPMIYCMPMLPFHASWCLPLPVPSSQIALPTHKLSICPTLKLTTHMLPYPKTQQKTHNPQRSCVSTGSYCMSHSRNRMVIWWLVSKCAKIT